MLNMLVVGLFKMINNGGSRGWGEPGARPLTAADLCFFMP